MPKYIVINKINKSVKPWIAHDWGNDINELKTKTSIDLEKIRHFDSSLFDKKVLDFKKTVQTTGEETTCRIIQLYTPIFSRTRVKKKAKKAAKKKK